MLFYFILFLYHDIVFVVKVEETGWSASYGVNKTISNPMTGFTTSWEKSNPLNPEHISPPHST